MSRAIELMYEIADKDKSDPMNNQKDMVTLTVNELEAFYQAVRREACAWQREQDATVVADAAPGFCGGKAETVLYTIADTIRNGV